MEFFRNEGNVRDYIKMAEGYDGKELIEVLKSHLDTGSTVLELGMGPGKDLDILREEFTVTGSDLSEVFIEMYRGEHPDADLLLLDARTLETDRTFDCIYSNKVLMHLSREDLDTSLERQKELLNKGGLLFHSFWKGDKVEEHMGLLFVYYTETQLREGFSADYDLVAMETYTEMEEDDSIYVLAKVRVEQI